MTDHGLSGEVAAIFLSRPNNIVSSVVQMATDIITFEKNLRFSDY